jgi:alkanesulfonate monooxygenase
VSTSLFWTLPASGDGRSALRKNWNRGDFNRAWRRSFVPSLTDERAGRFNYYDHLAQVARAAELATFDGVLIPWDPAGEEPWIVAASLAREARRLTFLPEFHAGFATPVYLAKMSVSFQRLSGNRLAWKIDVDRELAVRRAYGDLLEGPAWFERADEYLQAAKGVYATRPYELRGRYYEVEAGGLDGPLSGLPLPRIYSSGRSEAALQLAAKHADVHVLEAATLKEVESELERVARAAAAHGRQLKTALRLAVVARHTEEEAWSAVRELGAEAGLAADNRLGGSGASVDIWQHFASVGFDARVGLVGSYRAVAERLEEYSSLGVDSLILSSNPHLEEAYRLGEHVLSKLSSRARAGDRSPTPQVGIGAL